MAQKPQTYWQKRFEIYEQRSNLASQSHIKSLQKEYNAAKKAVEQDLKVFYNRLAANNDLPDSVAAKKLLDKNELADFKMTLAQYTQMAKENGITGDFTKQLENASLKYRISRLEAMKIQLEQKATMLMHSEKAGLEKFAKSAYENAYYNGGFEIAKGTGVGKSLFQIDDKKINTVIHRPWAADGKNFSERVWGQHRPQLVKNLHRSLTDSLARGTGPDQAIAAISHDFDVSLSAAARIVQTEEAYFSSVAQRDVFAELDVEQYQIIATLDGHTSDICQDLDGKVFKMDEYEAGVTAPPFHPRCRTTTAPYFDDEVDATRAARDPETGQTVQVPADMTYQEWKDSYTIDPATGKTKAQLKAEQKAKEEAEKKAAEEAAKAKAEAEAKKKAQEEAAAAAKAKAEAEAKAQAEAAQKAKEAEEKAKAEAEKKAAEKAKAKKDTGLEKHKKTADELAQKEYRVNLGELSARELGKESGFADITLEDYMKHKKTFDAIEAGHKRAIKLGIENADELNANLEKISELKADAKKYKKAVEALGGDYKPPVKAVVEKTAAKAAAAAKAAEPAIKPKAPATSTATATESASETVRKPARERHAVPEKIEDINAEIEKVRGKDTRRLDQLLVERHRKGYVDLDEFENGLAEKVRDSNEKKVFNGSWHKDKWAEHAKKHKMTVPQYIKAAEKKLQRLVDESEMFSRVPSNSLEKILDSGRLKTQFEVSASGGALDQRSRAVTEHYLFGYGAPISGKSKISYSNASPLVSYKPEARPVYGFLSTEKRILSAETQQYGDVVFKMKPSVRKRATFTGEDSLSGEGFISASKLNKAKLTSIDPNIDVLSSGVENLQDCANLYAEAQYHGGLFVDDIAEAIIDDTQMDNATYKRTTELLKKYGIKYRDI